MKKRGRPRTAPQCLRCGRRVPVERRSAGGGYCTNRCEREQRDADERSRVMEEQITEAAE